MARDLTPKQEAFCMAYVETGNVSEAYRRDYDVENMKPETVARVAELQAAAAERPGVTVGGLTDELNDALRLAHQTGQSSAATGAIMAKAKLHGLVTDKSSVEIDKKPREILPELSEEEAEWRLMRKLVRSHGLVLVDPDTGDEVGATMPEQPDRVH